MDDSGCVGKFHRSGTVNRILGTCICTFIGNYAISYQVWVLALIHYKPFWKNQIYESEKWIQIAGVNLMEGGQHAATQD